MTLTLLHSKIFDVCDLPVLTFGNCVLKTGVTKWPPKLFFVTFFLLIFQNPKTRLFTFLELVHTFSLTPAIVPLIATRSLANAE